jgi:ppGpp synthetase/RelA/SpoT-type nucleotidyltranferase
MKSANSTTEPTVGFNNLLKTYTSGLIQAKLELEYWKHESSVNPTDITGKEIQKWTDEINKYRDLLNKLAKQLPKKTGVQLKAILQTVNDLIGILKTIFSKL